MGVNTKSFDNASDMITFSRASGGYGFTKVSYGPELVTNGTFDTDSDWVKGTGWSISGGVAISNNASGFSDIDQSIAVTANKIYRLEFSVTSYTSGALKPYLGNNGNALADSYAGNLTILKTADSVGDFYAFFVFDASQAAQILFRANNGFVGSIDNISVKEVTYNSSAADATLQLAYHPNDVPRIEYNTDGTAKGLLVEEARTNNLPYSEDFTEWTALGVTVNSNNVISPDKNLNGTKLTSSGSGTQRVGRNINTTGVNCYSVFAKKGTHSYLQILDGSDAEYYVNFDLDSGSVGTSGSKASGQIQDFGNGWYRCTMVTDGTSSTSKFYIYLTSNASSAYGDSTTSTNYFYIYGAQFEAGSFPTSYIKTTGTTATRSADVASIPVADFGFHPNSKGTLFVEVKTPEVDQVIGGVALFNSTSYFNNAGFNKVNASNTTAGGRYLFTAFDGDSTNLNVTDANTGNFVKLAGVFGDGMLAVADGGAVLSGTERTPVPTHLRIGGRDNGYQSRCHIKSIKYYPRRLTDAQLQELTT